MTREEIRDLVRKKLGETTSAFWTDTEINTYINLGCKDVANRTKCLRSNTTIASISCASSTASIKSNEYTISDYISDFLAITELSFMQDGTDMAKLIPTSREELDVLYSGWRSLVGYTLSNTATGVTTYNYDSTPGTPTHYYWDREEDIFGLVPPPDGDNAGSDYIKVYYTYNHTDISSDSSSPTLPTQLHLAVVDFATATALETRHQGDKANDAWQKYFSRVKDYTIERRNEREDDEIVMKPYRNI